MPKGPTLFTVWPELGCRYLGSKAAAVRTTNSASITDLRPKGAVLASDGEAGHSSQPLTGRGAEAELTGLLQRLGEVSTDHSIQG